MIVEVRGKSYGLTGLKQCAHAGFASKSIKGKGVEV